MAPVVCSPKGRMRQLGFAELPGCLSVSSNDGGKGLPRLGEDGSFDWACTQLLGPRVHSRAAEGPLHLMKTSSKGIRTNPNSSYLFTLGEWLPRLALGFPPDAR